MKKILIVMTLLMASSGCCAAFGVNCGAKCTTVGAHRCTGDKLEICHGGKEWRLDRDCAKRGWKCGTYKEKKTCLVK